MRTCSVEGCGGTNLVAKGLCCKHYHRQHRQLPKVKARRRSLARKRRGSILRKAVFSFTPKVAKAVVLDGVLLDKESAKRGIKKCLKTR